MQETQNNAMALATIMNDQPGTSMCTIVPEPGNMEQAKTVYNAMNNPTHKLSDLINKHVTVENFLVEVTEMEDDDTGELKNAPKCVLISPDGISYLATSKGVFNSLRNACVAFGMAPWAGGIRFTVKQVKVGRGNMLTLDID